MSTRDNRNSRRISLASAANHRLSTYRPTESSSPRNSGHSSNRRASLYGAPSNRASIQSSSRRSSTYDTPRNDNWPVRISATRASGNGARWADRLDASTTSGFGMIPSPRQVDASYSENLKLYLSVLQQSGREATDDRDKEDDEDEIKDGNVWQSLGMSSRHPEDDTGMERWNGNGGLGIALDALSGRFGRIQAPIGLRDAAAGKGQNEGRQKKLSQNYFGNSYRLSGAW